MDFNEHLKEASKAFVVVVCAVAIFVQILGLLIFLICTYPALGVPLTIIFIIAGTVWDLTGEGYHYE